MKMVEANRPKPPLDVAVATAAADVNSSQPPQRRRQEQRARPQPRHTKTVHFEADVQEAAVAEPVATAASDAGSVTSLPDQFDRHVQQLFAFIGSALSARPDRCRGDDCSDDDYDDDELTDDANGSYCNRGYGYGYRYGRGGDDEDDDRRSVSDDETTRRRSRPRSRRKPVAAVAAASSFLYGTRTSFERDVDRGNPPFRHSHCKTTAGTCNRDFLKKVTDRVTSSTVVVRVVPYGRASVLQR